MPAPEALACRRNKLVAALVFHGTLPRTRRLTRPCTARPTHRVRFHIVSAGMGSWHLAEVCDAHRTELERLGLCAWSHPIHP